MVKEGGHSNYNANTTAGTKRSVTYPVAKMPFKLQKRVLIEVWVCQDLTLIIGTKPLFQFDRSSKTTEAAKKQLEIIAATEANRDADNSSIADVSEVLILVESDIY